MFRRACAVMVYVLSVMFMFCKYHNKWYNERNLSLQSMERMWIVICLTYSNAIWYDYIVYTGLPLKRIISS